MTNPNWGLLGQNNALASFQSGLEMGQRHREGRERREHQNALLQFQQQRFQAEQQKQRRADLPLMERLLDGIADEATYQQRKAVAGQYGIDVSQLPPNFDPAWVQQQRETVKLLQDPEKMQAFSTYGKIAMDEGLRPGTPQFTARVTGLHKADQVKTIPFVPGGGVAGYNAATGETHTIVAPNTGGYAAGSSVQGGDLRDGATATNPQTGEKIIFRNGQWQPASQGGAGGNVSSNFQRDVRGLPGETVTSTFRSTSHNARVGGVKNSYHLTGQARDSVPPPGMSMSEYARRLKALNPHLDVINEGDHVHMEPRG